jgi:hypothetical protein
VIAVCRFLQSAIVHVSMYSGAGRGAKLAERVAEQTNYRRLACRQTSSGAFANPGHAPEVPRPQPSEPALLLHWMQRQHCARRSLTVPRSGGDDAKWCREADGVLRRWTESATDTIMCFDLVMAVPDGTPRAEAHVRRTESVRKEVVADAALQHQKLFARATQCRADAVARLRARWECTRERLQASLAPVVIRARSGR